MADETTAPEADTTKTNDTTAAPPAAPAATPAQPQAATAQAPVDPTCQPPDIAADIEAYGRAETDDDREHAIRNALQKLGTDITDKRGYVENELRRRGMLAAATRSAKKAA